MILTSLDRNRRSDATWTVCVTTAPTIVWWPDWIEAPRATAVRFRLRPAVPLDARSGPLAPPLPPRPRLTVRPRVPLRAPRRRSTLVRARRRRRRR